ncbi:response regulator [Nonomuraea soli]|uniref:DNA-binding NarL/FixJ family response regulator n=1 Tax=Nonomuraea soli TaxID=1032476 RepID=A0A7W0CSQ6_9ACTN|nr:response regulator [Nonomuraea soli]MBA2896626.1 DNA-binding NarL/FixJ family response regulator [Nonomuraea soli]
MGSQTLRDHPGGRPRPIRVLIAEDVHGVRATLVALLELEDDLEVVAELVSGDEIVPAALLHRPDVAVLDIGLPLVDGLTAAAELRHRLPACRTVILTGLTGREHVRRALAAGAAAFLVKDGPADVLIGTIRDLARGGGPGPPG